MVSLPVHDDAHTPQVPAPSYDNKIANIKFNEVSYFPGSDVDADRVVDFDEGVGVSYSPAIVCHTVRNLLETKLDTLHFAKLVLQMYKCVCECV